MSRLGFYLLSAALCSLVVLGQGDGIDAPTTKVPEVIPVTHKTTTEPTTTEPPTTTPSTTTTKPTTTSSSTTTSTTTPVPPPTPPTPPAPTPKPTPPAPLPPPTQGTWTYTENNITCVVVQFAARFNVTYTKHNMDNSTSLDYVLLNVPSNASVLDGGCAASNGTKQWIAISWSVGSTAANNMSMYFLKNGTNYALQSLNVSLTSELFPNASSVGPIELTHGAAWQTPVATSYRCGAPTDLKMSAESAANVATLTISQLQEEAFRTAAGKGFSAARDCGGGDVPDAVPIAVGCALGGLVVVVLVAYLVARRRSAARGYLSM